MSFDYVATYNNLLPKSTCKKIIDKFESSVDEQEKTYLKDHRSFTEINIMKSPNWTDIQQEVFKAMQFGLGMYVRDFRIDEKSWPEQMGYEQIRIKRYMPNTEDEFRFHVDVQDYASARRFLVFFFYLNDVEQGGETAFQQNRNMNLAQNIKPEAGKLLIFPPLWTHPHVALPPITGPKYIMGSYLHYV